MRSRLLGSLVFGLLVMGLIVGTVFAHAVTESYPGPTIEIDGQTSTRPLTFTLADFPPGPQVSDVDISINWRRSIGSCENFDPGNAFHEETSFTLKSALGTTITLVAAGTYSGGDNIDDVTTVFDDAASAPPSGESAVSGTFLPTGLPLSTFNGENPVGEWTLFSTDNITGSALCLNSFSLTINHVEPVGGMTEFLADSSGSSIGRIALLAGGAGALAAIAAGGWFARRRWMAGRP